MPAALPGLPGSPYSPEARGRSERMFATLQDRLPKELRLAGINDIDEANRFIATSMSRLTMPASPGLRNSAG